MAAANLNPKKPNSSSSSDGSDLDPLWQNLDWYVLLIRYLCCVEAVLCWVLWPNVCFNFSMPPWLTLHRAVGQMLIMGWDGTEVTPQIKSLIEDHHLGSIILTAKNLKCSFGPLCRLPYSVAGCGNPACCACWFKKKTRPISAMRCALHLLPPCVAIFSSPTVLTPRTSCPRDCQARPGITDHSQECRPSSTTSHRCGSGKWRCQQSF